VNLPLYLALLAEAYGSQGQVEAGLAAIQEALEMVGTMPGYVFAAWLSHLQGELLCQAPQHSQRVGRSPEACLLQAVTIARQQQARTLALRAALRLSRLWQQPGKAAQACQLLADIYGSFTEGFDTADLQEAKALLAELEGAHRRR
jgi:predicted ATPase